MKKYVELGYPITPDMPNPGVEKTVFDQRGCMSKGDMYNDTVITMYLHSGTHVDAPYHFVDNGPKLDNIAALPTEMFVYEHPVLIDLTHCPRGHQISAEDLLAFGDELYEADLLLFNTGNWKTYYTDIRSHCWGFTALSGDAALFIRNNLPKVKAVGIDALSIESFEIGIPLGMPTHKNLTDPALPNHPVLPYEGINVEPIIGKKLLKAYCTPLRMGAEATMCNIICEIED